MYIAILGRQPALGVAELERLYGAESVKWFSDTAATVSSKDFNFNRLGGNQKAGRIVTTINSSNWRELHNYVVQHYSRLWQEHQHKITLGISVYGFTTNPREVQRIGIDLKKRLKSHDVSLRLVPNREPALNTATSHHNKLGLSPNRVELLIVLGSSGKVHIAESVGAQNITAIASRDQARPRTDAFVGMLPPKLARMMVNMAVGQTGASSIWDPFCGTGVVMQEANMLGFTAYGSDLNERMVAYTKENLEWLARKFRPLNQDFDVMQGDAMSITPPRNWQIGAIASESYLGQPFSAYPSADKLEQVRSNCDHIIRQSLANFARQLKSGTPLCLAVPAWHRPDGHFTYLPLIQDLDKLGYRRIELDNVRHDQLLYYRENQVVARQLLLLVKT